MLNDFNFLFSIGSNGSNLNKRRPFLTWGGPESLRSDGSLFSTMDRFIKTVIDKKYQFSF